MRKFFLIVIVSAIGVGCDLEAPDAGNFPESNVLLIAESDFSTGMLSLIDLSTLEYYPDVLQIYSDASVEVSESGEAFVLQRYGSDSLLKLNPENGYSVFYEEKISEKSNPQHLATTTPGSIAISLLGENKVVFFDSLDGSQQNSVDISSWCDSDGKCEGSEVYIAGDKLSLLLQNLDRSSADSIWPPEKNATHLIFDPLTFELISTEELDWKNPFSSSVFDGERLIVFAGVIESSLVLDGALVSVDLDTGNMTEVFSESEVGIQLNGAVRLDAQKYLVTGYGDSFSSYAILWDNLEKSVEILKFNDSDTGYFSGVYRVGNRVLILDRNVTAHGVHIYDWDGTSLHFLKKVSTNLPPENAAYLP